MASSENYQLGQIYQISMGRASFKNATIRALK